MKTWPLVVAVHVFKSFPEREVQIWEHPGFPAVSAAELNPLLLKADVFGAVTQTILSLEGVDEDGVAHYHTLATHVKLDLLRQFPKFGWRLKETVKPLTAPLHLGPFCAGCGQPCLIKLDDEDGAGQRETTASSMCCGQDLYCDPSLTAKFGPDPDELRSI